VENQSSFINRQFTCPICDNTFTSMRVRRSALNVTKIESDWHTIYHGVSPLHYKIIVCPNCFYAAPDTIFKEPLAEDICSAILQTHNKTFNKTPNFGGQRSPELTLLAFNLSLVSAKLKNIPYSETAGLMLGMAWVARESNNYDIEQHCLEHAAKNYIYAYEHESEMDTKLSDVQLTYIIGEIHHRIGNYNEAISWLSKTLQNKNIKKDPRLEKQAREIWQMVREEMKISR